MMQENSPICAMLMPACTDVRTGLPVRKAPSETPTTLPTTTMTVSTTMGSQWAAMRAGSISTPTETKKMAAKMSCTGCTRCSMVWPLPLSATREPAMKAPSATE